MRTDAMARTYIEQAKARLEVSKRALDEGNYPFAIRQSQECVELSLKGVLRLYGVEYPREHDVWPVLSEVRERFPKWFSDRSDRLGEISHDLAEKRGPSMYGDEEKGISPLELFRKPDAESALEGAEYVHGLCLRLFREFKAAKR